MAAPPDIVFAPRGDAQRLASRLWPSTDVLFLVGASGSGKTSLAVALGLQDVFAGRMDALMLCRPVVGCGGEELGHLPGTLDEKYLPWLGPVGDVLAPCVHNPAKVLTAYCEPLPLSYLRGRTVRRKVAVLDEAQNCSREQLIAFLTRLGEGGKLVLCGDPAQSDRRDVALPGVMNDIRDLPGIGVVEFSPSDIVRHALIAPMLSRLMSSSRRQHAHCSNQPLDDEQDAPRGR